MAGPTNTLLIEGTFEELVDEIAVYIDNLKKAQGDENSSIQSECGPLLQEGKKEDVLKKIVTGSIALNSAPEKEFIAAYNLLIHLILQAPNPPMFLARVCQNLQNPITSSPANGGGLALSILSTIFNTLDPASEARYHVFLATLRVIKSTGNFDAIRPQLNSLPHWLTQWDVDDDSQRKLYLAVSEAATAGGEETAAYDHLVRALRTLPADEASTPEARTLALRALKTALVHPSHFDFADLTALDAVQALRQSDPTHFALLEIFNADVLEDYASFGEEHPDFVASEGLDDAALTRKMRLLTLASIAASRHQERALPYSAIADALRIDAEDVEMWVIDVIRAGLVEGKLSQLDRTFLIHRSTYRVFGEHQWLEVNGRLAIWRNSLQGVLQVVRAEREAFTAQKEQEAREAEGRVNGAGLGMGGGRGRGRGQGGQGGGQQQQQQQQQQAVQQPVDGEVE